MFSWIYRKARAAISRLPGGASLLEWTDPLHLARRTLRQTIQKRCHYLQGWLLDLGCGGKPYREMFHHVDHYVGVDLPPTGSVEVYGSCTALPFAKAVFDSVLCNEVLEHISEPANAMLEAARVLKPGGILLLTAPQTWGMHWEPHDFYRYTKYGLRYLAEKSGLEVIEVIPTCGLWVTLAQRLADTVVHTYAAESSRWVIEILRLLLAPVLMAGYALDKLFGKRGDTLDYVMTARKPYVS